MMKNLSDNLISSLSLHQDIDNLSIYFNNSDRIGIVVDTSCRQSVYVPPKSNNQKSNGKSWLLLRNQSSKNLQFHCSENADVSVIMSSNISPSDYVNILDCRRNVIGYWDKNKRIMYVKVCKPPLTHLNITALKKTFTENNRDEFDKNVVELLSYGANVRFHIKELESDGLKSTELLLLQQISTGRCDIGLPTVLVTPDRVHLTDYSLAIEEFKPQLYYKVHSVRTARNVYILPFSTAVWLIFTSFLLAITIVLTFILGSETRLSQQHNNKEWMKTTWFNQNGAAPHWELSEVLLVTVGVITQQGSSRNPDTVAARTLFLSELVLAVLLYTAYSASIISIMSSPGPVMSTLQGILDGVSGVGLALFDNHYYHTQFKMEKSGWSYKLSHAEVSPSYYNLSSGMIFVIQGKAAFCADKTDAHTYLHTSGQTEETLCSVGEITLLRGPGYYRAFPLPFNSPYKTAINKRLLSLREKGILSRERRHWFRYDVLCQSTGVISTKFIQVTSDDIYPLLYLLGYGTLGALSLLLIENTVYTLIKYIRKRTTNTVPHLLRRSEQET